MLLYFEHTSTYYTLIIGRVLQLLDIIVTCWAEEKGLGLLQVLIHLVGDRHLCMSKGAKGLLISSTHFGLNVIKKQGKGSAAELAHLPCTERQLSLKIKLLSWTLKR